MREVTDRQKDRHTDTGDFIICPMLCYSNWTDNYMEPHISTQSGNSYKLFTLHNGVVGFE